MEVKGCSKRNRWHFCENGTVWNGVRPTLWCLDITCLCMLSFLLNDFSQTEQNQLMSTPQEQNVDWDRGDMLLFYIGFQAIKFYCFPSTTTTFPLFSSSTTTTTATATTFYRFPLTTTTATTSTFLLFSIILLLVSFFFSSRFYKRLPTAIISSFGSNVSCTKQQSWFPSSVSWLPCSSVSFKDSHSTTTTCTSPSLINILMGHFSIPEENRRILQSYRDALLNLARPDVSYKTKKRALVQEGSGFIKDLLAPVVSSLGFLML